VVLIIEACKSGSFIKTLEGDDRVIITSSKSNEYSSIIPSTGLSYTKFLAQRLLAGNDIKDAFSNAKADLKNAGGVFAKQHPQFYPENSNSELLSLKIGGDFAFADM
jgi:hypothetical protein